ncbi:MAG: phage tail tape measure protein [Hyphomicrobiaceae bacterium]
MADFTDTSAFGGAFSLSMDTSGFQRDVERVSALNRNLTLELKQATQIGRQFGNALGSAFEGLVVRGRSLSDTVRSLGLSLSRIAFQAAFRPLGQGLGQALTGLIGGGGTGGPVLAQGTPTPFAKGGVIASPIAFPLGGGTGIAGERGAEAIMPLARGPDGRLGVVAGGNGASGLAITFNVTAVDAESFRRSETQIAAMLARTVGRGERNL